MYLPRINDQTVEWDYYRDVGHDKDRLLQLVSGRGGQICNAQLTFSSGCTEVGKVKIEDVQNSTTLTYLPYQGPLMELQPNNEWDHISLSGAVTGKTSVKGTDVRSFKTTKNNKFQLNQSHTHTTPQTNPKLTNIVNNHTTSPSIV